jgi:hypothetical protein
MFVDVFLPTTALNKDRTPTDNKIEQMVAAIFGQARTDSIKSYFLLHRNT